MNPEIKAQWVAALRSGEFKQGRGMLHRVVEDEPDTFCCLGVLCVLAERAGKISGRTVINDKTYVTYGGQASILPGAVAEWAGLDSVLPSVGGHDLAHLNDAVGCTFEQIATVIEEYA